MKIWTDRMDEFSLTFSKEKIKSERWMKFVNEGDPFPTHHLLRYRKMLSDHWYATLRVMYPTDAVINATINLYYDKNKSYRIAKDASGRAFRISFSGDNFGKILDQADSKLIECFCPEPVEVDLPAVIKQCPCCGSQRIMSTDRDVEGVAFAWIECMDCGLCTNGCHKTSMEAARAWNRRDNPADFVPWNEDEE